MLGVQESNDFPVIILFLEKLYLLMRSLCLWFASLYRKASTQTVIQKTTLVSFCKTWSESMCWCQETGPFISCWERNFTFFLLSFFPFQGEKLCIVSLVPHWIVEYLCCILPMNRVRTVQCRPLNCHIEISYFKSVNHNMEIMNTVFAKTSKIGEIKSKVRFLII